MNASLLIAATLTTVTLLAAPAVAGLSQTRVESHPALQGSTDYVNHKEHDRYVDEAANRVITFPPRPSGK